MGGTLVWFRSDLRVGDHSALLAAPTDSPIHAVFVATPEQWRQHDWGRARVGFLRRNVVALGEAITARGWSFSVATVPSFAEVPQVLCDLAKRLQCDRLHYNIEHEVNELARDRAVEAKLAEIGVSCHSFIDQTILDVGTLRTGSGNFYSVFSPFKRCWLNACAADGWSRPRVAPPATQTPQRVDVPAWEADFDGVDRDDLWEAGETAGTQRLTRFVEERGHAYQQQRDLPAVNGTSTLSPYLALGVVSPRQCLAAAVEHNDGKLSDGQEGLDTWISELIWREFYRHVLIGFPRVCRYRPFREATDGLAWRESKDDFAAWCAGQTGVPLVDAGMRQLNQTGWMHNRVRMVVAMLLTKNLLIDWRWGERYFMQQLVDGDLASNNGGWQWSASTGTDAAPYFRIFNPFAQGKKFDPKATYIRRFVPELGDASLAFIHDPLKHAAARPSAYPAPIFDYPASRARAIAAFKALDTSK